MNCFYLRKKFMSGHRRRRSKQKIETTTNTPDIINCSSGAPLPSTSFSTADNFSPPTNSLLREADTSRKLRIFTFAQLKTATDNFSLSSVLGEGGFGCVYKGQVESLDEPTRMVDVAVKRLKKNGFQVHL